MPPLADGDDVEVNPSVRTFPLATQAIHADDHLNRGPDVAPALHVSTTFRYASKPEDLIPAQDQEHLPNPDSHIYSRETAPNTTRLEALLTPLLHAPTLTYTSGLAALHALYVFLHPARVSIGAGYHGSHGVLALHRKLHHLSTLPLDCAPEALHPGDVVHLETPLNPTGEAYEIGVFARKAHARGAFLLVDATFGPPGLQEPFRWGADVVVHSGTKFLGGHSDMLCGVVATRRGAGSGRRGRFWGA
ncbi:MAG: PLP-dependent transferase [Lasallia pustulata]|uniref:PLP-dependent transferase n=1 Tax=Lasallia pustulata TaxID=136370 RepID=A0A5M8Q2T6_9LECA|nr:MAG: PLP-dependent transferase [Lasallia pustulata]